VLLSLIDRRSDGVIDWLTMKVAGGEGAAA
jgi:hypothetical protein